MVKEESKKKEAANPDRREQTLERESFILRDIAKKGENENKNEKD